MGKRKTTTTVLAKFTYEEYNIKRNFILGENT